MNLETQSLKTQSTMYNIKDPFGGNAEGRMPMPLTAGTF